MNSDISDAASNVIELTNRVGSTVVDVQNATHAARMARDTAAVAARHPGRLAVVAAGMLATAGVLALRRERLAGRRVAGTQTTTRQSE